jgi:hypothetical protein
MLVDRTWMDLDNPVLLFLLPPSRFEPTCMLHGLSCLSRPCASNILRRSFHRREVVMDWSANVLSTVTSDTEPTIIVEFHAAKYIFNVGENTNRAFIQNRSNWRRTRGLFLTSVCAQRAGGLTGKGFATVMTHCG